MIKRYCPFLMIVICFSTGILLQKICGFDRFNFWLAGVLTGFLLVLVVLVALAFWGKSKDKITTVLLLFTLVGLGFTYTYSYRAFRSDHIYFHRLDYIGRRVRILGVITSEIRHKRTIRGAKSSFILEVQGVEVSSQWYRQSGRILAEVFRQVPFNFGDQVVLSGSLNRPYDFARSRKFSYRRYLRHRGILYILKVKKDAPITIIKQRQGAAVKQYALSLRDRCRSIFKTYLTPTETGLMQALLIGDRSEIPVVINRLFRQTGTAHILAISGLHIGIVTVLFFILLKLLPIPLKWQYGLTILLLGGYVLLTGARPSVTRAAVMAMVFLMGFLLERETDGINSLALAGWLILLINPLSLFDIGFQLSFTSVVAIILFYPRLIKISLVQHWSRTKWGAYLMQSLVLSLTAWSGVAGLIAYYFAILTPITIAANLLIVPLMMVLVILGLGLLIVGNLSSVLGLAFAACIKVSLNGMVILIYQLERIPYAYIHLRAMPLAGVFGYYILLAALLWVLYRRQGSKGGIDKHRELC